MSGDVLGQPWEETMSEPITAFCQITADALMSGRVNKKYLEPRPAVEMV